MKKMFAISSLLFFALFANALASPVLYPTDTSTRAQLKLPDDVEVVSSNADNHLFYVLPPANAYAYANTLTLESTNLSMCQSLAKLGEVASAYTSQLQTLISQAKQFSDIANIAEKKYEDIQLDADKFKSSNQALTQISKISSQIVLNQARIDKLGIKNCSDDCDAVNAEINSLIFSDTDLQNTINDLSSKNYNAVLLSEQKQAAAEDAKSFWQSKRSEMNDLSMQIADLMKLQRSIYQSYANLEGGYAAVEYSSDWESKMDQLRSNNPGFTFQKMDLREVQLNASILPSESPAWLAQDPGILSATVNGLDSTTTVNSDIYQSKIELDLRLSLVGACPFYHPELFPGVQADPTKAAFGLGSKYKYYAAFTSHAKFIVDENEFYRKVMNAGNSGFLFWKSSWENIDITQIDTNAYTFEWNMLDPNNQVSYADRRKAEAQAVDFIIMRLVEKYGTPQYTVDPALPPVPTSGLSEIGQGIDSLCGAENIYCKATAWIMKGIDEIIGSGSSSASGTRTFEAKGELEWTDTVLQLVPGSTSYVTHQNLPMGGAL